MIDSPEIGIPVSLASRSVTCVSVTGLMHPRYYLPILFTWKKYAKQMHPSYWHGEAPRGDAGMRVRLCTHEHVAEMAQYMAVYCLQVVVGTESSIS